VPRLLEPQLIQSIAARFRSLNVVASAAAAPIAPMNVGRTVTQTRAVPLTNTMSVTALVQPASRSPADLQTQAQVSDELSRYIAAVAHAIVVAHDNWRQRAFLTGVQINGVTAIGGSISGPPLSEMLIATGPNQGLWGNAAAYTAAIGSGLAAAWREWEQSVRVPGLPWYPTLAAVPARQAPPVANVPTPLSRLASTATYLSADYLSSLMARKLGKPGPYSDPLFTSVADGFSKAVNEWLPTQMVTNVLGRGPIPVFAPPYVPVGPVVGGSIVEAGPHFAT